MTLIVVITIAIYLLAIAWTWNSLGTIEKTKKVITIIIGIFTIYLITFIIFIISKGGIEYQEIVIENDIRNMLVALFTGLNSLIFLPYIARLIDKVHEGEIAQKNLLRKVIWIIVIFVILVFIESGYMKNIQQGILKIYNSKK